MENIPATSPAPKSPHPNKLIHLVRKVFVWAVVMLCINFFLKLTGWDTWKNFSTKADNFAENIMDGALRLTPLNLFNSIKTEQHTYELIPGRYFSTYKETGKVTLKNKILNWLGYYWFTQSGKAFWIGRLLLIIALIYGIYLAADDYKKEKDKIAEIYIFPFKVLLKFFVFLLVGGALCLLLYFIIKIFVAIGSGIVAIVSGIHATGGFAKLLLEESKNEIADSSKSKVAAFFLPFILKKKKES